MDVNLFQTVDGGEIEIENGVITMDGGLKAAAYLSLFGGNEDDDGSENNPYTYWGNIDEDESKKYTSLTQNLLQSLPATSNNLLKINDAALKDLEWFLTDGLASNIEVFASIKELNSLSLLLKIDGEEITFTENWQHDYNKANQR